MLTGNGRLAMTSSTPGKTKVINHFLINDNWYLVDLPGYGYAKMSQKARAELQQIIRGYILESQDLVCLFVLVDSRFDITKSDIEFLAWLGENGVPFSIIFTKCDKQSATATAAQVEKDKAILLEQWEELPPMFTSSSAKKTGREEILAYIDSLLSDK